MLLQFITYNSNDSDQSFCKVATRVYLLEGKSSLADQVGNQYVNPEKFDKGECRTHTSVSLCGIE